MVKLFSKTEIIMPGGLTVVKGSVFEATPRQARHFDHLNAARAATAGEIKDAAQAEAIKNAVG